jgi:hypothetical protein
MNGNAKKTRKPWSQEARANQAVIANAFWAKRKAFKEAAAVDRDETNCASQPSPASLAEVKFCDGKPFRPSSEVRIPEWAQGAKTRSQDLAIGQRVFHHVFYHGKLVALDGDNATVQVMDPNGDAKNVIVDVASLITLSQAKPVCDAVWKRGKPWRVQRGLWLWVVRGLCAHGEWEEVLAEQDDYPKSSANHYIREFKKEVGQPVQARQLADEAKQDDDQTAQIGPFEAAIIEGKQTHTPARDPEKDARNENKKTEADKRVHVVPSPDKATLSFQRRNLDPQTAALFRNREKARKELISGIKIRKLDELIAEVLALDPTLFPAEAMLSTTVDSTVVAPETGAPAVSPLSPVDADVVARIRAHLRKQGVKKKALGAIKWIPGLTYTEQYHSALKQLPY